MQYFAAQASIVRTISGDADTILIASAGAAAEFALNRAVDWLFFTGKLPRDPIGRFFTTMRVAQEIVFAEEEAAQRIIKRVAAIHSALEQGRGQNIPDWAYRDVLYMLIDYAERAYRLLHRPLTVEEQYDLYDVFRRLGVGLQIPDLPNTYAEWQIDRQRHLQRDLAYSDYTAMLYAQYRHHLGPWRYALLRQLQALLVPDHVRHLLGLQPSPGFYYALQTYRVLSLAGLRPMIQRLLIQPRYLHDFRQLEYSLMTR
jgi:hypothetical protein